MCVHAHVREFVYACMHCVWLWDLMFSSFNTYNFNADFFKNQYYPEYSAAFGGEYSMDHARRYTNNGHESNDPAKCYCPAWILIACYRKWPVLYHAENPYTLETNVNITITLAVSCKGVIALVVIILYIKNKGNSKQPLSTYIGRLDIWC